MKVYRIRSFAEKLELADNLNFDFGQIINYENKIIENKPNFITTYSYTANASVQFNTMHISNAFNWREELICPVTNLNNRVRAAVQFLEFEFHVNERSKIYLSEQVTPLYTYLKSKFPNLIGSEYLGLNEKPGFKNVEGIRHEDLTNLSFENNSLDFIISLEVFEHISSPNLGFKSCFEKLKKNGALILTVPFLINEEKNLIRAKVDKSGKIYHLLEPEYHKNPIDENGSLCFTHFGWEILDQLKTIGFKDAYVILYWSSEFGYFGGLQTIIIAKK